MVLTTVPRRWYQRRCRDDGTDDGADDGTDDGADDGTDDGADDGTDDGATMCVRCGECSESICEVCF